MKFEELKRAIKKYYEIKCKKLSDEHEAKRNNIHDNSEYTKVLTDINNLKFINELELIINDYLKKDGLEQINIKENITEKQIDSLIPIKKHLHYTKNDNDKFKEVDDWYNNEFLKINTEYAEVLIAIDLCGNEEQARENVLKAYGIIDKKTNKLVF